MQNKDIKKYLESQNFVPSKKMGQNFLLNKNTQLNIVKSANVNVNDYILEIGPGMGAITEHLLNISNNVLAVELDKRLYSFLKDNYPNLILINDDILKFDVQAKLIELNWKEVKVVANLPYSISSLIILKLIKIKQIKEINILVQKEMAERLCAKMNTKDYNAFTVLVSIFADVSISLKVSRNDFLPPPNVDSLFIKLSLKEPPNIDVNNFDKFMKLCFLSRRKKLTNNLSNKYDMQTIISIFNKLNLDLNTRAESLSPNQFIELFKSFGE